MTTHIKKNQKIARRIIKKIVRKIGCRTCRVGHPVRTGHVRAAGRNSC
jgi:hypothetical protein